MLNIITVAMVAMGMVVDVTMVVAMGMVVTMVMVGVAMDIVD